MARQLQTLGSIFILTLGAFVSACAQTAPDASAQLRAAPLNTQQVVANMEQRNRDRALALKQFEGSRLYRMEYRGFLKNEDAEMTVSMNYCWPDKKNFTVLSQSGSKFVIEHVFKKLLEAEQEALQPANLAHNGLTSANYEFELVGYEETPHSAQYVLAVTPREKTKFLYVGKIWIDANDFAVTRVEAEPAKNPSFWIKKSEIRHTYAKVDGFWLPSENHTESMIRVGGKATLSIEYSNYKITLADAPQAKPATAALNLQ